ncbi:MAG: hypothetical protein IKZ47_05625 [Clostridia bacterium]|nr:hypothetical protein [Clostridia bacterium]
MEDLNSYSSYSSKSRKKTRKLSLLRPLELFGKFVYKNIAKVIKLIAYVVAIATIVIGIAIAFFIFKHVDKFVAISYAIVLGSAIIAFIEFFIIYGIGHIIEQNDKILKRLGHE